MHSVRNTGKVLCFVLALLLCLGLFTGCGGSNAATEAETTPEATPESSPEATPEATPEETAEATPEATAEPTPTPKSEPATFTDIDFDVEELLQESTDTEGADVRIIALKGPTAMGMVEMMRQVDDGALTDNQYSFSIAAAIDEVTPQIAQGNVDIAAVPANLASVLFNNTQGGVQVLAINTLGVLYIVENGESVQSVEDLRGKTLYASGKGATPEYALDYILSSNGIDPETDISIEWKSEHAECLAALLADENGIAMLPQPFVTTAQMQNESLRVAIDLTEAWDDLQKTADTPSALVTGVCVVRTAYAEEHPEAVRAFLSHYADSVAYVQTHTEEAAALVGQYDIVPEQVAVKALPACNIVCITGDEMREKLSGYLSVLMEQNPTSIGGAMPTIEFYYTA